MAEKEESILALHEQLAEKDMQMMEQVAKEEDETEFKLFVLKEKDRRARLKELNELRAGVPGGGAKEEEEAGDLSPASRPGNFS